MIGAFTLRPGAMQRVKGKQVQILYDLVTVIGEKYAIARQCGH